LTPRLLSAARPQRLGRVSRLVGLRVEVEGVDAAVGEAVRIYPSGGDPIEGEVVSVAGRSLACMPYGDLVGVRFGTAVEALGHPARIEVGTGLMGRVLDGLGRPIDGRPLPSALSEVGLDGDAPHPLDRQLIDRQLPLGVRSIDTLIPCGRGQRLGIFAGSGVGKSTLLSMIARGTEATVSVLALVGERGREVNEFLTHDLGEEGLARSVVVVATSDEPALVRIRAAFTATRIAEWFRDQGHDVVLMMDSLTRFAMAQREVGLSAGEPPATRGYPPSVFSLLARLLERAGCNGTGSITGLYTVLVEADDMNEPIADAARSLLDGHVVLSRRLATSGHFPSVDVLESVSRLESAIVGREHRKAAVELRQLLAAYRDARDLVEIGAYVRGTNPVVDRALVLKDFMDSFLRQDMHEPAPADASWASLSALMNTDVSPFLGDAGKAGPAGKTTESSNTAGLGAGIGTDASVLGSALGGAA
jgi:flagellum-specific ATP synthase